MPPATDKNHEPDELNCVPILALCQEEPQCPSIVPGAVSPTPGDNHTKHETGMNPISPLLSLLSTTKLFLLLLEIITPNMRPV